MKFYHYSPLIISLLFITSCKNNLHEDNKTNHKEPIVINLEKNLKNFKPASLSQLGASINYIPLETSRSVTIGTITGIEINKEYILISGKEKKVYLYQQNGIFISTIGKQGRGPNDFILPLPPKIAFGLIYVPDLLSSKIQIYNFKGEHVNSIKVPENHLSGTPQLKNWHPTSKSSAYIYVPITSGDQKYRLIEINDRGDTLSTFPNTTFFQMDPTASTYVGGTISKACNIYEYGNALRMSERLVDTIRQITNDTLLPIYITHRGRYGIPTQLLGKDMEQPDIMSIRKNLIWVWRVFETKQHLFLLVRAYGENYPFKFKNSRFGFGFPMNIIVIYDKEKDEYFSVAPSGVEHQLEPLGIENDIDGGINFAPTYSPNERTLVSWFNAYDLKAHVASEEFRGSTPKYPERKRELEALANRLKIDDNPVLMVVTFKE
ncbi:MAG: 6-bladed beta-propeller [Tenuifilaceae bacterium]|nr:6-bladed beta-propeller [Tenuifilaceae bacterium]